MIPRLREKYNNYIIVVELDILVGLKKFTAYFHRIYEHM